MYWFCLSENLLFFRIYYFYWRNYYLEGGLNQLKCICLQMSLLTFLFIFNCSYKPTQQHFKALLRSRSSWFKNFLLSSSADGTEEEKCPECTCRMLLLNIQRHWGNSSLQGNRLRWMGWISFQFCLPLSLMKLREVYKDNLYQTTKFQARRALLSHH